MDVFGKRAAELRSWPEQTSDADANDQWTDDDDAPVSGDATAEHVYFTYDGGPDYMAPHTSVITDDVPSGGQASATGRAGDRRRRRPRGGAGTTPRPSADGQTLGGQEQQQAGGGGGGGGGAARAGSSVLSLSSSDYGTTRAYQVEDEVNIGSGETTDTTDRAPRDAGRDDGGEDEDEEGSDHGGGDDDDGGDDGGDDGSDDGSDGGGDDDEGMLVLVVRDPSVPSLPLTRPEAFAQAGFDADDLTRLDSHGPFRHTGRRSGKRRPPGGAYSPPPYIVDSPRWSDSWLSGIRGRESGPVDGGSGCRSDGGGSAGSMPPPPARSTKGGADATTARAPVAGSPPSVAGGVAGGWAAHRRVSDRMRADYDAGRGAFAGRLSPRF
ncbi:hypothetical protein CBR_g52459 [Chara braunii]|uniref:Uncharacterized protein n=1 Tax=Chara braunii TaxID=69332 RepID=A0A388MAH7_CHABU|nr:hypothetical protein CBR_g52459 [Chara braunii]|eukprot:GBG91503.1 hypothetical protein CBR_g52459 [Chara braunii]